MVDTAANAYPEENADVEFVYAEKTDGSFIRTSIAKLASSVSGAATGQMFYVNSSLNIVKRNIGSEGAVAIVSGGLPDWSATGSNGQYFVWSGGAPGWGAGPSAIFQLIDSEDITSTVASVVFNDIPSSGYSHFILVWHDVSTDYAGTLDSMMIQVSTDNGSTWKTSAGDYYSNTSSQTALRNLSSVSGNTSTFKFGAGSLELHGLGNAGRPTFVVENGAVAGISATNLSNVSSIGGDGGRILSEADNAFRILPQSGTNFLDGTFYLYGVATS